MTKEIVKNNKNNLDELISLTQASLLCNYSQEYLSLMSRKGKLAAVKQGRNWKISRRVLFAYIEEHRFDIAGNNRGDFSDQAQEIIKIYKKEKILNQLSPSEIINLFKSPKTLIPSAALVVIFAMLFAFGPVSKNGGAKNNNFISKLFNVTVVRGANYFYQGVIEGKNIAYGMRKYISGESRKEVNFAATSYFGQIQNKINKFNNFLAIRVVAEQYNKIFKTKNVVLINNNPFDLLKWDLNSYPKTISDLRNYINYPATKSAQDLMTAFTSFRNNTSYVVSNELKIFNNDKKDSPRVAGVQERANEKNDEKNFIERLLIRIGLLDDDGN